MSMNFNQVTLAGVVQYFDGVKYGKNNKPFCSFKLCVVEHGFNGREDKLTIKVSCFGELAEKLGQTLFDGANVLITGKLQRSSYVDRNQQTVWETAVVAFGLQFAGSDTHYPDSEVNQDKPRQQSQGSRQPAAPPAPQEDIPF